MCKFLFSLTLLCLLQTAECQRAGKAFTFTGNVINTPTGYVYLSYIDSANLYIGDSCKLINGRFKFSGYISSPVMATFKGKTASRSVDDPKYTDLFIEPGKMEGVFPESDFKHSMVTGSKSQMEYTEYVKQLDKLDRKWKTVLDAFDAYRKNVDEEKNRIITDEGLPLYNNDRSMITRQFIFRNPQSHVSAVLLYGQLFKLPIDSSKIYFSRLAPEVRNSKKGHFISEFIHKEEAIAVGQPAPDFMQPDTSGAPIWLHDYKGKYVLLDIWASWCKPCREEHPYLRQAYEKYSKKGFTILSLSMDREQDKTAWLTAIAKDNLTWPQLCDFTVYQNKVVNDYNVLGKGIPANFLISPDGNILAINLRGEEVEKKLSEYIR